MMPSCDQIGVPIHFHSSTTSGSASLMSLRILPRVFPRQSPSSAILFEMSSDADWPWLAPDFFMFSSLLCEQFTGNQLTELPEIAGPTVEVFDSDRYITGPSRRDARWRVAFNGLGSISYCVTVQRTAFLQEAIRSDVLGRTRKFIGTLGKGVLDRT